MLRLTLDCKNQTDLTSKMHLKTTLTKNNKRLMIASKTPIQIKNIKWFHRKAPSRNHITPSKLLSWITIMATKLKVQVKHIAELAPWSTLMFKTLLPPIKILIKAQKEAEQIEFMSSLFQTAGSTQKQTSLRFAIIQERMWLVSSTKQILNLSNSKCSKKWWREERNLVTTQTFKYLLFLVKKLL